MVQRISSSQGLHLQGPDEKGGADDEGHRHLALHLHPLLVAHLRQASSLKDDQDQGQGQGKARIEVKKNFC